MAQPPPVIDDPTGALASSREEETARALAARYHLEYVDVASFADKVASDLKSAYAPHTHRGLISYATIECELRQ